MHDVAYSVGRRFYPVGQPIVFVQQTHGPECRLAPRGRVARLAPDAHLPPTAAASGQRLAGIADLKMFARLNFAGVPQIAVPRIQLRPRGCDQNLVSRLAEGELARLGGRKVPREAGVLLSEPERFSHEIAA